MCVFLIMLYSKQMAMFDKCFKRVGGKNARETDTTRAEVHSFWKKKKKTEKPMILEKKKTRENKR